MEIFFKIGLIVFWFAITTLCGTAYFFAIVFAIKKGLLGDTSAKVVYFLSFVIVAAIVYKLPLL